MVKIILISCTSRKRDHKAKAKYLYDKSSLFRRSLAYAMLLNPDKIFILSAKHHLLNLESEIEPYDVALNNMSSKERKIWAKKVLEQMSECSDLQQDHFIILAGQKYRQYLLPQLKSYEVPMQGLRIGKQLQYLKQQVSGE